MISGLLPNFPRTGQKAQLSKSEGQENSRASNLLTFHLNPLLTQKKWFYLEFWRWKFLILKLMIQKISPSTQGSMVYIICPTSETGVPDSPAPLCGFGQLTDLPRILRLYVMWVIVLLTERLAMKIYKDNTMSIRYQSPVLYRYTQIVCSLMHSKYK